MPVHLTCSVCGKSFVRKPAEVKDKNVCSRPCMRAPSPITIGGDGTAMIPLLARNGDVKALAIIDAADAAWAGQWRWCLSRAGYAVRNDWSSSRPKMLYLHRELLGLSPGDGLEGDHINRNKLDNRRSNLRAVTRAGNAQNYPAIAKKSSVYRGVHLHSPGVWRAKIEVHGKVIHLGLFTDEQQAAEAARAGRARLMPYATD